jgi:hypothetical protein
VRRTLFSADLPDFRALEELAKAATETIEKSLELSLIADSLSAFSTLSKRTAPFKVS